MNETDRILSQLLDAVKFNFNPNDVDKLQALIYLMHYQILTNSLHKEDVDMLMQTVQQHLIERTPASTPSFENSCQCGGDVNIPAPDQKNAEIRFKVLGFDPPAGLGTPDPFYFPQDPNGEIREFGRSYLPFQIAKLLGL